MWCGRVEKEVGAEPSLLSRAEHEGHCFEGERTGSDLPLDTCDLCAAPLEPFTPCPESPGSARGGGCQAGLWTPSPPSAFELAFIFLCCIFQLQSP